jgi:hypothetical protein
MDGPSSNSEDAGWSGIWPYGPGNPNIAAATIEPNISNPLHPQSPVRFGDWRWLRAIEHVFDPESENSDGWDEWFAATVKCVNLKFRAHGELNGLRTDNRLRAIDEAYQISLLDNPVRWALEAWILTGASAKEIATKCGLGVDVVEAYEAVFFDVRSRLSSPSFIMNFVIGPRIYQTFTEVDVELVWRLLAFVYRWPILDDLIELSDPDGRLGEPGDGTLRTTYQTSCLGILRILIRGLSRTLRERIPQEFVNAVLREQDRWSKDRERILAVIPPSFDVRFEVVGYTKSAVGRDGGSDDASNAQNGAVA